MTFVIGSALVMEDLKKVRADIACGMFFLCNTEVPSASAALEDAATVMRALSVSNFNPDLDCLVQVLKPEDRTILKDSDVDVILCLDEFKTALQARNAICPGFSTFIENIFHSFGGVPAARESSLEPWYQEYLHGARMEMYYVPLDPEFLRAMNFSFNRVCEAIYIEYGIIVLGLCSSDQDEMTFNPTLKDLENHKSFKSFFSTFNVALIIADDQMEAEQVTKGLSDMYVISHMLYRMEEEEEKFRCQPEIEDSNPPEQGTSLSRNLSRSRSGLKAFSTIKHGMGGIGKGVSAKNPDFEMVKKNTISRIEEPISDDDSDDEYVGYAGSQDNPSLSGGRRMSASSGGGVVVTQAAKKNLVSSHRRHMGKAGDSLLSHANRLEENEDEDENEDESKEAKDVIQSLSKDVFKKSNSLGDDGKSAKKKDSIFNKFKKAATTSTLSSSTSPPLAEKKLAIRNTLKNMHMSSPENSDEARSRALSDDSFLSRDTTTTLTESPSAMLRKAPMKSMDRGESIDDYMAQFGKPSKIIDKVDFENHIIVLGNESNFHLFLNELRRPAVVGRSYHPILLVAMSIPPKWENICARFNDVYLLIGSLTRSAVFNKINIDKTFAVILLASRDGITKVEEENIDSDTLFVYLKLEQYIPRHVFFSVELTCSSNMAVLNATIMRRTRLPEQRLQREQSLDIVEKLATIQQGSGQGSNEGRFTSKRSSIRQSIVQVNPNTLTRAPSTIGRRASTIDGSEELLAVMRKKEDEQKKPPEHENPEQKFWDATDTHHMLPVFAAARAYVPSTFESLLVQSFFGVLTPLICEKLVCGQSGQTVLQIDVPKRLEQHCFLDLFRKFSYHHVIAFGIYRHPRKDVRASLPYVFISSPATVELHRGDRVFVYGKPSRITRALNSINEMRI